MWFADKFKQVQMFCLFLQESKHLTLTRAFNLNNITFGLVLFSCGLIWHSTIFEIWKDTSTSWLVVECHVQQYFSYIVMGQLSSFPNFDLLPGTQRHGQLRVLSVPSLPRNGHRDVFNLLAIRGPTRGEGKSGIQPGSSDPQSSLLPLHGRDFY